MNLETVNAPNTRLSLKNILLASAILPISLAYPLCYLVQKNAYVQSLVVALTIFMICLSWKRWKASIFLYIFCIPLFNTITQIIDLDWPGLNFNAVMISALATSWFLHYLFKRPISDDEPDIYCVSTPFDGYILVFVILTCLSLFMGWFRYSNIFSAGFLPDACYNLKQIPFFNLQDNFLCFTRFWQFALVTVGFYLIVSSLRQRKDVITALWLIIIAGVIVCVYGIIQRNLGVNWVGVNWFFKRINATLNGPDSAAIYFACIVLLCIPLYSVGFDFVIKLAVVSCGIVATIGMILTGTRTAVFALVIVVIVFALNVVMLSLVKLKSTRNLLIGLVVALFFLIPANTLVIPFQSVIPKIKESRFFADFDNAKLNKEKFTKWLSFRNYHWHAAGNVVKKHPISGAGLGTFDKLYKDVRLEQDNYKTAFAHALYLDVYIESGIFALINLILMYIAAAFLSWKLAMSPDSSPHTKNLAFSFLAINIFTFISNFFTSSFYYVFELQLFLALIMGLLVILYNATITHSLTSLSSSLTDKKLFLTKTKKRRKLLRFGLVLFALYVIFNLFSNIKTGQAFFMSAKPYSSIDRILEYGIFHYETDQNKNKFARTAKNVYKPLHLKNRFLRMYLRADHPDANQIPVKSSIYIDDHFIQDIVFSNRNWSLQVMDLNEFYPELSDQTLYNGIPTTLHISSDRTWNPFKAKCSNLNVEYGIDLGSIDWGYFAK